jgi:hypothetical protein
VVRSDVVQSHVESLLERMLDDRNLRRDDDGSWPMRNGSALYRVSVGGGEHPHVEVWSVAVEGVRPTKALYERINDYNRRSSHGRWFLADDRVVVTSELVGETLDLEELTCSCEEIGAAADVGGLELQRDFGGRVSFAPAPEAAPATGPAGAPPPRDEGTGGYL